MRGKKSFVDVDFVGVLGVMEREREREKVYRLNKLVTGMDVFVVGKMKWRKHRQFYCVGRVCDFG